MATSLTDFNGSQGYSAGNLIGQNGWTANYYGLGEPSPLVNSAGELIAQEGEDSGAVTRNVNLPPTWSTAFRLQFSLTIGHVDAGVFVPGVVTNNSARAVVAAICTLGSVGDGAEHVVSVVNLVWGIDHATDNSVTTIGLFPLVGTDQSASNVPFGNDTEHLVTVIYDGAVLWILIDGTPVAVAPYPNNPEFGSTGAENGAFSVHFETQNTNVAFRVRNWSISSPLDVSAPTLSDFATSADGSEITATVSEAGCLPASGLTGFVLSGTAATANAASISGTTLTIPLTGTVDGADAVTISSQPPTYRAAVLSGSPLGYWRLGEAFGTTAADSSGNAVSGTFTPNSGGAWTGGYYQAKRNSRGTFHAPIPTIPGDPDFGADFTAANNGRIELGAPAGLSTASAFTLECLVNPASNPGASVFRTLFAHGSSTAKVKLWVSNAASNCLECRVYNSAGTAFTTTTTTSLTLNALSHVAVTYDDAGDRKVRVYVNGSEVAYSAQPAVTGTLRDGSAQNMAIGCEPGGTASRAWDGIIDEFAFYGTSLDGATIALHATLSSGLNCVFTDGAGVFSATSGNPLEDISGVSVENNVDAIAAPTVTTTAASDITATSAVLGGNVTSDGGAAVTNRGVCWATTENPTYLDNNLNVGSGTGEFEGTATGLLPNTLYYSRAWADNSEGLEYGANETFTTLAGVSTRARSRSRTRIR